LRASSLGVQICAFIFVLQIVLASPVFAVDRCALEAGETVRVTSIVDGDTVGLADGREVRLVGLQAPKLALGRTNFDDWPLASEAKSRLAGMVLDRTVRLAFGGTSQDRYGRVLAHIFSEDGSWIQARMIAAGMARVYSFPDNRSCVETLLAYEGDARFDQRGIWADDYYAPQMASDTEMLLRHQNSFQLVEGRVRDVANVRGRIFLNFGQDWRSDFTVTIAPRDARRFEGDFAKYANAMIRVRGWLKSYNGPEIVVTHPEQIEFLEPRLPPS
jgi:endonuclease YncB( thermonuclease family)